MLIIVQINSNASWRCWLKIAALRPVFKQELLVLFALILKKSK